MCSVEQSSKKKDCKFGEKNEKDRIFGGEGGEQI